MTIAGMSTNHSHPGAHMADALEILGLRQPDRLWARNHDLGIEYYAVSAGGHPGHPNEDSFWCAPTPKDDEKKILRIAVIDEASQKKHIASRQHLVHALSFLADSPASATPHEVLHALHQDCRQFVHDTHPEALAGLSIALIYIDGSDRIKWASVGDIGIFHCARQRRWNMLKRHWNVRTINVLQTDHWGRLEHAIGHGMVPLIQYGRFRLEPGEIVAACSDGAHAAGYEKLLPLYRENCSMTTLFQLGEHLLANGRLNQKHPDDATIVLAHRILP